jgi:hypothetical protein
VSISFIVYVVVGKLLIFFGQKFPYFINSKIEFVRKLFECDMCLGFWIYFVLAAFLKVRLFDDVYVYVPLLSEIITGCATSFAMHLLSIGWREKFSTVII